MRKIGKYAGAGLGAMALAATAATPAMARENNGIGTTEVIAGAAVLVGLVALLSGGDDDDERDNRYYGDRYYGDQVRYDRNRRGNNYNVGRAAIEQCVYATERQASRYGARPDVTKIRDVDRKGNRMRVKGKVEIRENNRWNRNNRATANFTCTIERGRVVHVDIDRFRG